MKPVKDLIKPVICLFLIFVITITLSGQTRRLTPEADHFIVRCKLLINPAQGLVIENAFIEVNNGRILKAGEQDRINIPDGVKVFDYSDKFIIPGLIDTHGHLFTNLGKWTQTNELLPAFYLAAGVTSVRSPGSSEPEGDIGLRNRINSGRFLGPRYFHSGPYVEADPVSVGWMQPVKTPEEARLKIDQWVQKGATSIKLYAAMSGDVMKAAIEHGHAHGVKVIAHIGAVTYREAIEMGIDELFHGILAFPELIPPEIDQKKYLEVYESLSKLELDETEIDDVLKLASENRVVLTPTAVVMEPLDLQSSHMLEQKKYFSDKAWAALEKRAEAPMIPNEKEIMQRNIEFIRRAYKAGCILTTGTDQVGAQILPGYSLWREMEIFAEAGLKPIEILKAATYNSAYAIGISDLLGSVEPGKLADFVVLNASPLENISNIRSVCRVIKGGVVYEPEQLLKRLVGRFK